MAGALFGTGMPDAACRDCSSLSYRPAVLCPGVLRYGAGRRGGGIADREEGFRAIPGCAAEHTGNEE
jgi:hypothetical protein